MCIFQISFVCVWVGKLKIIWMIFVLVFIICVTELALDRWLHFSGGWGGGGCEGTFSCNFNNNMNSTITLTALSGASL